MTDGQWEDLLRIIDGELLEPLPVGFLVDAPWVTGINNIGQMDYFTDNRLWLDANLEAVRRFPDVLWLPGFWAEFGMISNPPAFGAKCIWPDEGFPTCETVLGDCRDIPRLRQPDVRTDGLLPFIIRRLEQNQSAIEAAGHRIRFATSHGPLTIASYLLGHTEFFMACRTDPEAIRHLLRITTQFVVDWLVHQKEKFPTIDGVLVLEDFMGFVGEQDFREFVLPYMTEIFGALEVSVRFLHNDAFGLITARYLEEMGVNLFNFSFEHDFNEIRQLAGEKATLLGNIPPRDVLGLGTCEDIRQSVAQLVGSISDPRRVIISAGGFTPAQFSADKIGEFCDAVAAERL
ncbi:MAG: uroporphyrinogen decarboxylase [Pirellulaceae bacterium]|nr:uroporphyrinogen decarboxylase [Pirellulaceae bacterium]